MNENTARMDYLCWVCSEKVSKPEWYTDSSATTHVVHDWCVAGAVSLDRRLFVEERDA